MLLGLSFFIVQTALFIGSSLGIAEAKPSDGLARCLIFPGVGTPPHIGPGCVIVIQVQDFLKLGKRPFIGPSLRNHLGIT